MPVEFGWYDEANAISYCKMWGKWTWDEFYVARQDFRDKTQSAALERVDLIWEVTHDAKIPANFVSVMKSAIGSASANWNITVVVKPSLLFKSLFGVVEKSFPYISERYPFADTYEEAKEIILRHRSDSTR